MTAPARMAPVPHKVAGPAFVRPRITGEESIPTRITGHHGDHRYLHFTLNRNEYFTFLKYLVQLRLHETQNIYHINFNHSQDDDGKQVATRFSNGLHTDVSND